MKTNCERDFVLFLTQFVLKIDYEVRLIHRRRVFLWMSFKHGDGIPTFRVPGSSTGEE